MSQHVVDNYQPLRATEVIPVDADALPFVEIREAVEARNAGRAREAAAS